MTSRAHWWQMAAKSAMAPTLDSSIASIVCTVRIIQRFFNSQTPSLLNMLGFRFIFLLARSPNLCLSKQYALFPQAKPAAWKQHYI